MPDVLSYIDLEEEAKNAVISVWAKESSIIEKELYQAVLDTDSAKVEDVLAKIDFSRALKKVMGRLEAIFMAAMIFGARNVVGDHAPTFLQRDDASRYPPQFQNALQAFENIHTVAAANYIRQQAAEVAGRMIHDKLSGVVKKFDQSVVDQLNSAVMGNGRMISSIAANLTTSRLASFGFLAQAQQQQITHYQLQAVLDSRTSKLCRILDGRTFDVATAYQYVNGVLQVTDPNLMKVMAPFVPQDKANLDQIANATSDQLMARGIMVPPFHPGCRTILMQTGQDNSPNVGGLDFGAIAIASLAASAVAIDASSASELDSFAQSQAKDLPSDMTDALASYASYGVQINEVVASGDDLADAPVASKLGDPEQFQQSLTSAIKKSKLTSDLYVYKAAPDALKLFDVDDLNDLVGSTVKEKGFLTGTAIKSIAAAMADHKGYALIRVRIPKGSSAILQGSYDDNDTSGQVIMLPGTRYRILSVTKKAKSTLLNADVATYLIEAEVV